MEISSGKVFLETWDHGMPGRQKGKRKNRPRASLLSPSKRKNRPPHFTSPPPQEAAHHPYTSQHCNNLPVVLDESHVKIFIRKVYPPRDLQIIISFQISLLRQKNQCSPVHKGKLERPQMEAGTRNFQQHTHL